MRRRPVSSLLTLACVLGLPLSQAAAQTRPQRAAAAAPAPSDEASASTEPDANASSNWAARPAAAIGSV